MQNKWLSWDTDYVDVLDGIRVIGILIVLWFHFWQQTWLMPYYPTPFLKCFGITTIDFNSLRRCGYLCVDLMILLSGFVLFLPYAKQRIEGKKVDSIGTFYRKRFARIVPSYVFAVLVMFFIALRSGVYAGRSAFLWRDLLMHLTFTFMVRPDTYLFSGINGVFWTVVIEMLYYTIFPFLAKWFEKKPLWTYLGMLTLGAAFTFGFCLRRTDISFMVNRFLTFLPVFANGMLAAFAYVWFVNKAPAKAVFSIFGTLFAAVALWGILRLFRSCSSTQNMQIWQLTYRIPLSFAYTVFTLGIAVSVRPVRLVFSNRVMRSLSVISYNLYLWHQFLIVRLRMALGCSSGSDVAALGVQTQWMLHIEALVIALSVAALTTYLLEKPMQKLILHGMHK